MQTANALESPLDYDTIRIVTLTEEFVRVYSLYNWTLNYLLLFALATKAQQPVNSSLTTAPELC